MSPSQSQSWHQLAAEPVGMPGKGYILGIYYKNVYITDVFCFSEIQGMKSIS